MSIIDTIRARRDEILDLALRHKVEKLWVFGSCARAEERADSDVDLLVKWVPGQYSWKNERELQGLYERLFGRSVDLVSSSVLPRSLGFAHRICREAIPV